MKTSIVAELIVLFVVIPLMLLTPIPIYLKVGFVLIASLYCIVITKQNSLVSLKGLYTLNQKGQWKRVVFRLSAFVIISSVLMYIYFPENLFIVVRKAPIFWVSISLFYSVFSVYPQAFLYRAFFFNRYGEMFENKNMLIFVNAVLFAMAHLIFKNEWVIALTFIGGLQFGSTYYKSKSLMFSSIEHAFYGCWLFALGVGEMLAFPMPE